MELDASRLEENTSGGRTSNLSGPKVGPASESKSPTQFYPGILQIIRAKIMQTVWKVGLTGFRFLRGPVRIGQGERHIFKAV
jgi:hypothetical protein